MTGYAYTPLTWLMLASPAILLVLAREAWPHRWAPISLPLAALVACLLPWGPPLHHFCPATVPGGHGQGPAPAVSCRPKC